MNHRESNQIVIEPGGASKAFWKDLWNYRELFYFLALREILIRYKQTAAGIAWAFLRPILTLAAFTFIFSRIVKLDDQQVPYSLLVLTAILPWHFFSTGFVDASNSLIADSNLISKVYFPRLVIPVSSAMVSLIDFFVAGILVIFLMIWHGFFPDYRILVLPIFFLLSVGVILGAGFLVSALNVRFRDFRYIVPFLVQIGIYISPIGFSSKLVPDQWKIAFAINPMVGIIEGFRWSLLRGESALTGSMLLSCVMGTACIFVSGIVYFRKTEKTFADII